jgi:hypothetical protein
METSNTALALFLGAGGSFDYTDTPYVMDEERERLINEAIMDDLIGEG